MEWVSNFRWEKSNLEISRFGFSQPPARFLSSIAQARTRAQLGEQGLASEENDLIGVKGTFPLAMRLLATSQIIPPVSAAPLWSRSRWQHTGCASQQPPLHNAHLHHTLNPQLSEAAVQGHSRAEGMQAEAASMPLHFAFHPPVCLSAAPRCLTGSQRESALLCSW